MTTILNERTSMKLLLKDIILDISWARLSVKYLGKSRSWLHQKLNGVNNYGEANEFSDTEKIELKNALKHLAIKISEAADRIE